MKKVFVIIMLMFAIMVCLTGCDLFSSRVTRDETVFATARIDEHGITETILEEKVLYETYLYE